MPDSIPYLTEAAAELSPRPRVRLAQTLIGGVLMGLANVIPGVSGGTMLLAVGLYESFIEAVAEVSRFRFHRQSILFLALLGGAAASAILLLVGPINWGLTNQQHALFALFIGLTLGGVPTILARIRPLRPSSLVATGIGFAAMIAISFALTELDVPANWLFFLIGGLIASSAMVLPGISGSYLLLVMGLYFPVTSGVDALKDAVRAMDVGAVFDVSLSVVLPVGLGVLVGIATLSNLIEETLRRFHDATMGVLLGLLLGSVVSLNPFQAPGHNDPFPAAAEPTLVNIAVVVGCLLLGLAMTYGLSHLGRSPPAPPEA